jgi:hypothetical protein
LLAAAVLLGVLAAGCQEKPPPSPPDRKTLEREAEKLRQQNYRERNNK